MDLYVKASFDSKYYGEEVKIDDYTNAIVGGNAFDDLEDALEVASDGDTIILLDKTVTEKLDYLYTNGYVTVKGGKRDEIEGTQTSEATLNLTGTWDDMPLELSTVNFDLFKSVKIVNAKTGYITGGDVIDSEKDNGNGTGKWTDEIKAVGTAHIGDDSEVSGDISGFNSIVVEDDAKVYGNIIAAADESMMTYTGSYKDEESSTIDQFKEKISGTFSKVITTKTAGSAKISEAEVGGMVAGYSTVTIKDVSEIGTIDRGSDSVKTYKVTYSAGKNDTVNKVVENSTVNKASGSLTATDSTIGGDIIDYNTVSLTNTNAGMIKRDMLVKNSSKTTGTIFSSEEAMMDYGMVLSEKDYILQTPGMPDQPVQPGTTARESTFESKAAGNVTLKIAAAKDPQETMDMSVGGISGYANVTATGYDNGKEGEDEIERGICITGEIIGGEVKETDNAKYDELGIQSGKWVDEYKAAGTVKLKTNVTVEGSISGYNTVDLSDSVIVNGKIDAANANMLWSHNVMEIPESMMDEQSFGSFKEDENSAVKWDMASIDETKHKVSGTDSSVTTIKGAASFKADDDVKVQGSIAGYTAVTLKETDVYGNIDRGLDQVVTDKVTYTTAKDNVTKLKEDSTENKASGSLTADNSSIQGNITDYNTVSLTNTSLSYVDDWYIGYGNITRNMLVKDSEKKTYVFGSVNEALTDYINMNQPDYVGDDSEDPMNMTAEDSTFESKAAGNVTLKIAAAKGQTDIEDMYVGGISGYANVTATGYDNGKQNYDEVERNIYINGSIYGGEVKETDKVQNGTGKWTDEIKAAGTVKLKTNVTVEGSIFGYNTVDLSDSVSAGMVNAAGWDMLPQLYGDKMMPENLPMTPFGSYKEEESIGVKWDWDKFKVSGTDSKVTTVKPATSFKASDGVSVMSISGYSTVSLSEASVGGNIERGKDEVVTLKYTYNGNADKVTKVVEKSIVAQASGSVTAVGTPENNTIAGEIKDYNTVSLTNISSTSNISRDMLVKDSSKSTYVFNSFYEALMTYNPEALDEQYMGSWGYADEHPNLTAQDSTFESKASGNVTLKVDAKTSPVDMQIGAISGYSAVTATGFDDDMGQEPSINIGTINGGEVKQTAKYDVKNDMMSAMPAKSGKWLTEYKASGSVKLATEVKAASITGYNTVELKDTVTVEGSVTAAGIDMLMQHNCMMPANTPHVFGSFKEETSRGVKWDMNTSKVSGTDSKVTTVKAASSFKAQDDVTVGMGVYGFATVSLAENSTVTGGIALGQDRVTSNKITYASKADAVTVTYENSIVNNAAGSLTASDSSIQGDINNYKTVSLTNTSAGMINCAMQTKNASKKTYQYNSFDEAFMDSMNNDIDMMMPGMEVMSMGMLIAEDSTVESKAAGTLTVKVDGKNEPADINVGSISGYTNVTATGYYNSKDDVNYNIYINGSIVGGELKETDKVQNGTGKWVDEYKAAGSVKLKTNVIVMMGGIVGYNTVELSDNVSVDNVYAANSEMFMAHGSNHDIMLEVPEDLPEVFGSYKEEDNQSAKVDYSKRTVTGTNSSVTTIKAASNFKAEDDVTVMGVYGYSTVSLKNNVNVNGMIARGADEVITDKYTYSTDKSGNVTRVYEHTEVYNASGSVTALDSYIMGDITDYNTVTLTNTSAGNITRAMDAKVSVKGTYSLGSFDNVSMSAALEEVQGELTAMESTIESKAAGNVTLKIDAKSQSPSMAVGDIEGYANVTATGYDNGKSGIDEVEYKIYIGSENGITGGETKTTIKDGVATTATKAAGSVKLKTNIEVAGGISGYSTVDLSDSVTVGGNISAGDITNDSAKVIYTANGKLTMSDDSVVIGDITGFKDVSAKESTIDGSIIGGNTENKKQFRSAIQLGTAVGTLEFNEVFLSGYYCSGRDDLMIAGFKTVKLTNSDVHADIDCFGTKGTAVTLDDCEVRGEIRGAQQLTVKNWGEIESYIGTDYDDTFTVAAKTVLEVTAPDPNNFNFGAGNDKFVVDGTVLLNGEIDFNSIDLESMTGKGCIAVTAANYDSSNMLKGSSVELLNLGNTIDGFHGKDAELADNTKAVVADWDVEYDAYGQFYYEYEGWLGTGKEISFEDSCDQIKFKAEISGSLSFEGLGDGDMITVNGTSYGINDSVGIEQGVDYIVSITRAEDANSTHYSMILA